MRHEALVRDLLARPPGTDLTMLDPRPLTRVRAIYGQAIATTNTHVLHEWRKAGQWFVKWDEKWQVHKVTAHEWQGEPLD